MGELRVTRKRNKYGIDSEDVALSNLIATLNEKISSLQRELELNKSTINNVSRKNIDLTKKLEISEGNVESLIAANQNLSKIIGNHEVNTVNLQNRVNYYISITNSLHRQLDKLEAYNTKLEEMLVEALQTNKQILTRLGNDDEQTQNETES